MLLILIFQEIELNFSQLLSKDIAVKHLSFYENILRMQEYLTNKANQQDKYNKIQNTERNIRIHE